MSTYQQAKRWMERNYVEHVDGCNEINCTGLAEAFADRFEIYEPGTEADIPEWVFDLAAEVAMEVES